MNWAEQQAAVLRKQLRNGLPPRIEIIGVEPRGDESDAHVVALFRHHAVRHVVGIRFPLRDDDGSQVSLDHEWRLWQLDELFDAATVSRLDATQPDEDGVVWRDYEDL